MADPANAAGTNPGTIGARLAALHRHLAASVPQLDRIGCALYDRGEDLLKTFVNSTRGEALRGYEFHLADSPSLRELARSGRDRLLPDLPAALSPEHAHSAWVLQEGYLSSFTVPLQGPGGFLGFVFFDSRRRDAFDPADQRQLQLGANLLALTISVELLSLRALRGSVGVARAFCDLRDFETGAHLERMSRYARLVAKELAPDLGLTDEYVEQVFLFAPLHDVGKIGIPDRILLKPGPLDPAERETMKSHVDRGVAVVDRMVADLGLLPSPAIVVLRNLVAGHHECLDGSGYPRGARGAAVPLEARLTAIADIFDALTSPRPYKAAWPPEQAFAELERLAAAGKLDARGIAALRRRAAEAEAIRRRFLDPEPEESAPEAPS